MKDKIRVMHLVESLDIGGMENGIVNIANHIDPATFEFMICCFTKKGQLADRINNKNVKLIELKYNPGIHIESIYKLNKIFRKYNVQILHTHGWGARSLLGYMASRFAKLPICINGEHGVIHINNKIQLFIQCYLGRLFDGTLSVSEGLKHKLIKKLGLQAKNIEVIRNGVNIEKFHGNYSVKKLRDDLNILQEEYIIGAIGSLKKQKNQSLVLKAVALLKKQYKDVRLILIGDGPDKSYLQDISNMMNIEDNVIFLGNRDDIPELLSLIDILVLPSIPDHEGLSNVILEAMSSRVPVISTKSVGSRELIDDKKNGIMINHKNPTHLMEQIVIVKENKSFRDSIVEEAWNRISEKSSIQVMVKNYERYYKKMITEV